MNARHLHGFLTHAPIAFLVLGALLHGFRTARGAKLRELGRAVMYLSGLSLLSASASGAMTLAGSDVDSRLAGAHSGRGGLGELNPFAGSASARWVIWAETSRGSPGRAVFLPPARASSIPVACSLVTALFSD